MHSSPAHNVAIVILAAGKGTRMQNNGGLPKVLTPLYGQPLITHLLHSIEGCRVERPPVIVVGYEAEMVKQVLGNYFTYVEQKEQLGTGHAVAMARSVLEGIVDHVLVLYGDHPHLPCEVIDQLLDLHLSSENAITMMTTIVSDFEEWRKMLHYYGRIIRGGTGQVERIVEFKDATEEERLVGEVNPGYYCFRASWLWENLERLSNKNNAGEYYLTDLIKLAIDEGARIGTQSIDPLQALGVNTIEEMHVLEEVLKKKE